MTTVADERAGGTGQLEAGNAGYCNSHDFNLEQILTSDKYHRRDDGKAEMLGALYAVAVAAWISARLR